MALTKKQIALIDSCPVLKGIKEELVEALGGEAESSSSSNDSGNETTPTTRTISVTVTDGTDPVNGATVTLTKSSETIATGTTGSAGGCSLSNVADDTYTIEVTKEGFTDYTASVTTSADNTSLEIELTATSTTPSG